MVGTAIHNRESTWVGSLTRFEIWRDRKVRGSMPLLSAYIGFDMAKKKVVYKDNYLATLLDYLASEKHKQNLVTYMTMDHFQELGTRHGEVAQTGWKYGLIKPTKIDQILEVSFKR